MIFNCGNPGCNISDYTSIGVVVISRPITIT